MIIDLISFIVRFVILNPMTLLGICGGSYVMLTFGADNIDAVLTSPFTYALIGGIGLLYALLFKHVYYPNSEKINWMATISSSTTHIITLAFAAACGAIIIYSINYGLGNKLDQYVRYEKD